MDTPQVTPELLGALRPARLTDADAVLGPAVDGGWWALGLRDRAHARVLASVPMSTPDTGRLTLAALRRARPAGGPLAGAARRRHGRRRPRGRRAASGRPARGSRGAVRVATALPVAGGRRRDRAARHLTGRRCAHAARGRRRCRCTCVDEDGRARAPDRPGRLGRRVCGPATTALLARCAGPTLDVGCGPGRLTGGADPTGAARASGIDISAEAVRQARGRGAPAMRARRVRPAARTTGRWQHVLLADGNIGIGGDPVALLRRCRDLLAPGGRCTGRGRPARRPELDRARAAALRRGGGAPPFPLGQCRRPTTSPPWPTAPACACSTRGRRPADGSRTLAPVSRLACAGRSPAPAATASVADRSGVARSPPPCEVRGSPASSGVALGVAFTICFATGLLSHLIQHPPALVLVAVAAGRAVPGHPGPARRDRPGQRRRCSAPSSGRSTRSCSPGRPPATSPTRSSALVGARAGGRGAVPGDERHAQHHATGTR